MQIYDDIYKLEKIVIEKKFPFAYFFMITDYQIYANPPRKKDGLRATFNTSDGYKIKPNISYVYKKTEIGRKFFRKHQPFIFRRPHIFQWQKYEEKDCKYYFLKMKI